MSSNLAAELRASNSSLERFESKLLGSQEVLAGIKRKHVFPFMDLPEDLRRIILEIAMPDQAKRATCDNCHSCGREEYHQTAYDAVRRLHINSCYADGSMKIARFSNLREFIFTDWRCRVVQDISHPEYFGFDLPDLGEGWTVDRIFRCVLLAKTLKYFTLQITRNPNMFWLAWSTDFENGRQRLTEWLSEHFKARGSNIQVSVRPVIC